MTEDKQSGIRSVNNHLKSITRWNPSGSMTNCGFCAISYALDMTGRFLDADQVFLQTLNRLDIDPNGEYVPPRMLIFPKHDLDECVFRGEYTKLEGRGRSPADYTLTSVARGVGLSLSPGDKGLLNALIEFAEHRGPGWTVDEFAREKMKSVTAKFDAIKSHILSSLAGTSIIGSYNAQHYVTMTFNRNGDFNVFDPQIGGSYEGRLIRSNLGKVHLFERITTS